MPVPPLFAVESLPASRTLLLVGPISDLIQDGLGGLRVNFRSHLPIPKKERSFHFYFVKLLKDKMIVLVEFRVGEKGMVGGDGGNDLQFLFGPFSLDFLSGGGGPHEQRVDLQFQMKHKLNGSYIFGRSSKVVRTVLAHPFSDVNWRLHLDQFSSPLLFFLLLVLQVLHGFCNLLHGRVVIVTGQRGSRRHGGSSGLNFDRSNDLQAK